MVRFIILWQIPFLKRLMDLDSKQYESGNFLELCFISIWTVALELVSSLDSKVLRSPRICRWQTRCQACPRTNLDFWLYKLFILSDKYFRDKLQPYHLPTKQLPIVHEIPSLNSLHEYWMEAISSRTFLQVLFYMRFLRTTQLERSVSFQHVFSLPNRPRNDLFKM